MSWVFLAIAIFFEVLGTTCMKMSAMLTRLWPSLGMFLFYAIAFVFLSLALKKIPVSIAYAIWSGIGVVLITLIDLHFFKTPLSATKIIGIGIVLMGTVVLKA